MSQLRPTVLLADDHPVLLAGLKMLLEPALEVVATATDGGALLEAAERLRPDLVVADVSLPVLDGIAVTRRLQTTCPGVKVLILTIHAEPSCVREAFAAGACGYLTKTVTPEELDRAVREVLADRFYISPAVARAALDPRVGIRSRLPLPTDQGPLRWQPAADDPLTPREVDILHLLSKGLCNKEIAGRLGVTVTTVRTHLRRLYQKLSVESRVELALYAAQADAPA